MLSLSNFREKFLEKNDADLLIEYAIKKQRSIIYTNPNYILSLEEEKKLNALFLEYQTGKPVAYLIGTQAFWTMDLWVTPDVLIPRFDTECLVRYVIENINMQYLTLADLGTGSGAIAIALALENPGWIIHATDFSHAALRIAQKNAVKYKLRNIKFYHGNWSAALPQKNHYDLIISNPPYIAQNDSHLLQLAFEPQSALISGKDGLEDIKKIIMQSKQYLKNNGVLILEHGFDQAEAVLKCMIQENFQAVQSYCDLNHHPRFCVGVKK